MAFWKSDVKPIEETPMETPTKKRSPIKGIALALGGVIGIAHIGLLGYVLRPQQEQVHQPPAINIPHGPYSSYRIKAGKDGYEIEFRADDPKILESERSLDLDKTKKGFFGGSTERRTEYRSDQYTREGTRNIGGETTEQGKSAKDVECLIADAGARSQGAMAGSAIAAGVAVPAVASIPYVGWLAGGWALLLGQKIGSEAGSQVGQVFNDC
ncbi:gp163 [Synechococcus phage syn9]|uniref:Gp163 n=1 Tax=Synechococcus phage syn9 TaxID=382359 RepID=Q0QZ62_BPSYS|nr:hypothetical protein BSV9_gp163 [Synechococcus phage syn9]ABA47134.1 gp163 [Synechococcus phage syn9]